MKGVERVRVGRKKGQSWNAPPFKQPHWQSVDVLVEGSRPVPQKRTRDEEVSWEVHRRKVALGKKGAWAEKKGCSVDQDPAAREENAPQYRGVQRWKGGQTWREGRMRDSKKKEVGGWGWAERKGRASRRDPKSDDGQISIAPLADWFSYDSCPRHIFLLRFALSEVASRMQTTTRESLMVEMFPTWS